MLLAVLLCDAASSDDGLAGDFGVDGAIAPCTADPWEGYCDPGVVFWTQPPGPEFWTVEYRIQQMFDSSTSYQFGTQPGFAPPYAPLSKLDWSLNSTWTGLRIGAQDPCWDIHFEWLAAIGIDGYMKDYDWNIDDPRDDPTRLDSLSRSSERWTDGQKLELEVDYHLADFPLGLPIECWPLIGFRFQRFDITGTHGVQIIPNDGPFPPPFDNDIITFNQQYYIGYAGAQLRTTLRRPDGLPIHVTLQADYGATAGYNVDHHLSYEYSGIHRYTMESTTGGALHFGLTVESLLTPRLSLGVQADHMEISTTGNHRMLLKDDYTTYRDETWSNGVSVTSRQTSITAFLRLRI